MKTLSFTAGLLLAVSGCDASPLILKSGPDYCCFNFFNKRIPKSQIRSIEKTHSRCDTAAFVVKTSRGDFCVRQSERWAMGEFVKHHEYERPIKMTSAPPQHKPNTVVYMKQFSSTGLPSCVNPEGSRPESTWNNFNEPAVDPEHEDRLLMLCLLEQRASAAKV